MCTVGGILGQEQRGLMLWVFVYDGLPLVPRPRSYT